MAILTKKYDYELNEKRPYSIKETSILLGVSTETVRRLIDNGELKSFNVKKLKRVYGRWIKEFIEVQEEK